ncbi:hypothetical protein ScPMuIL_013061 [Solemya velum]
MGQVAVIPNKKRQPNGEAQLLSPSTPAEDPVCKQGDSCTADTPEDNDSVQEHRVYKRRWLILGLFCLYSLSNAYQWIHLNIIVNIFDKYYSESLPEDRFQRETALDWLSMIYMLAYIPLIFPTTWLLDKKGLRLIAMCGSCLNAIGACLKCGCVSPDRFALLMFAQTTCAIAQVFILGLPARLAAVWFGPNEVSTATAIGVFGNQVGVAVGFLLPPLLVPNSDNLEEMGDNIANMFYGSAAITSFLFILVVIVFRNEPPHPPSRAQYLVIQNTSHEHYGKSLVKLFKNRNFVILMVTYGVNTGSYYAISTLLNPVILHYYPGHEKTAGEIGLTLVLAGVLGSILAGIWLDKTKTFKGTTVGIYALSLLGMIGFTFLFDVNEIWVVFLTGAFLGFFMTGYLPVGFEFAAEITYPESEGTSSGLLNASAQTFGIILTISMRAIMNMPSVRGANLAVSVALLLGTIMTAFIGADYRRQRAGEKVYSIEHVISKDTPIPKEDTQHGSSKDN